MLGTIQYDLTWKNFEKLHPDKRIAFENLCRSLFRKMFCTEDAILHSEPNHPGVEVVPVLSKNGQNLISFQAKYFENNIDYNQITKSVYAIIQHYSDNSLLNIVYLYCNKDITEESSSYKKIKDILRKANIDIVLVTGQTILDQAAEYPTILSCYFGLDSLDGDWFKENLDVSLADLGKRYNSLFNIDTEALKYLSIFLREDNAIKSINEKKKNLLYQLENYKWRCDRKYIKEINSLSDIVKNIADITFLSLCDSQNWKDYFINNSKIILKKLQTELEKVYDEIKSYQESDIDSNKLRDEINLLEKLINLPNYLSFQDKEIECMNSKIIFITGEMGTGKSQLLATSAKRIMDNGQPVLLLLGQTYTSNENIEIQIMSGLVDLNSRESFESLLAVLSEKANLIKKDAIIFIDAINETRYREVWKNGINRLISKIEKYENIRLVISLRTGFEELTLSEKVNSDIKSGNFAKIIHRGFINISPQGIYDFLSYNGIPFSPEYYLKTEMTNPLFLTWFCQTYSEEDHELIDIIEKLLAQADKEASKEAGSNESIGMLKDLLNYICDIDKENIITKANLLNLPVWTMYGVTNKIAYLNAIERAGIIASYMRNKEEIFYIGYNLLKDYLIANNIIIHENDKEKIREYCIRKLLKINEEGIVQNYGNESIFGMVLALYAKKYNEECLDIVDLINDSLEKDILINEYLKTIAWRNTTIKYEYFLELINKYSLSTDKVWSVFIENATKEKSELNALWLSKFLNKYKLNKRDYIWTISINELNENDRIISLAYFIENGNKFNNLSKNKIFLLLVLFAWMLSSSNRILRDRLSKSMIEILKNYFSLCQKLLENFKMVDDPYIIQRLYGIIFGAVMKRTEEYKEEFYELTKWIYNEIFNREFVYPDILLRDYARLIVERFLYEYNDKVLEFDILKIKPPYKSIPIPRVEEVDYSDQKFYSPGIRQLLYSMKFDIPVKGFGLYGDFGRYTFQSAVSYFQNVDIKNIYYYALNFIFYELGYSKGYFFEYDDKLRESYDRHYVKKTERIGKKYQWIAMYNILARLSDSYKLELNFQEKIGKYYEGAWEPYVRDFDPTLNSKIKANKNIININLPDYTQDEFIDFNAADSDIDNWVDDDGKMFQDFPKRLIHKDEFGIEWVTMYFYQENKIKPPNPEEKSCLGFLCGEQWIWSHGSMYIADNSNKKITEKDLIDSNFIKNDLDFNEVVNSYTLFSREYAWSPGYKSVFDTIEEEKNKTFIKAVPASINVLWEEEYDASQEDTTSFIIPTGSIINEMGLYEKEIDGIYYCDNEIAALDLSILGNKHNELVIRKDIIDQYINKTKFELFWVVVGEKQYFLGNGDQKWRRREGYFVYNSNKITGNISTVNNI